MLPNVHNCWGSFIKPSSAMEGQGNHWMKVDHKHKMLLSPAAAYFLWCFLFTVCVFTSLGLNPAKTWLRNQHMGTSGSPQVAFGMQMSFLFLYELTVGILDTFTLTNFQTGKDPFVPNISTFFSPNFQGNHNFACVWRSKHSLLPWWGWAHPTRATGVIRMELGAPNSPGVIRVELGVPHQSW